MIKGKIYKNKIIQVIESYFYGPLTDDDNQEIDYDLKGPTPAQMRSHLNSMIPKMKAFLDGGQMDKCFRWLGFMQGVLWALGIYSLNELREHNRSDPSVEYYSRREYTADCRWCDNFKQCAIQGGYPCQAITAINDQDYENS